MVEHSDEYRKPSTDALRNRIIRAIEDVSHEPGSGTPCELCVGTADAVMAVLANADPTDLGYRPRPEETHTVDVGYVHVLATPGGPCAPTCPHPDHHTKEETTDG